LSKRDCRNWRKMDPRARSSQPANQQALKVGRPRLARAWRLYFGGGYTPTRACREEAEQAILGSSRDEVRREAQEKRYALGASAIASASDRAVGVTGAPAGAARARAHKHQSIELGARFLNSMNRRPRARLRIEIMT
jgi:hypothetical protein